MAKRTDNEIKRSIIGEDAGSASGSMDLDLALRLADSEDDRALQEMGIEIPDEPEETYIEPPKKKKPENKKPVQQAERGTVAASKYQIKPERQSVGPAPVKSDVLYDEPKRTKAKEEKPEQQEQATASPRTPDAPPEKVETLSDIAPAKTDKPSEIVDSDGSTQGTGQEAPTVTGQDALNAAAVRAAANVPARGLTPELEKAIDENSLRILAVSGVNKKKKKNKYDGTDVLYDGTLDAETLVSLSANESHIRQTVRERGKKRLLTFTIISILILFLMLFIIGFFVRQDGDFTIQLGEVSRNQGLSLYDKGDFANNKAYTRLVADGLKELDDNTYYDVREILYNTLDVRDGSHNSHNYFAYTFYIANEGTGIVDYNLTIKMLNSTRGMSDAVRVVVVYDTTFYNAPANERKHVVLAKPNAAGEMDVLKDQYGNVMPDQMQDNATPFQGTTDIYTRFVAGLHHQKDINTHKYTVVIYLEGGDPDMSNNLKGASLKFSIDMSVVKYYN